MAIQENRLRDELRRRFRSPQEALRALGLDENLLKGEEMDLSDSQLRRLVRRERSVKSRDLAKMALDARMRVVDEADPDDLAAVAEELPPDDLEELIEQLSTEDRKIVADAVRGLLAARNPDAVDRRRSARDQPDPFGGMPVPGSSPLPLGSTSMSDRMGTRDRGRSARFAHDIADRKRGEARESFAEMFPEAMRIGTSGF